MINQGRHRARLAPLAPRLALLGLFTFVVTSGFICTGSQLHRATVAEHDFKTTVAGFQSVEIAEFQAGHVDPALHQAIAAGIIQVAQTGQQVALLLQAGQTTNALAEVKLVDTAITNLLNDGVLHIANATTKGTLQIALEAVQGIVTQVEVALQ